MPRTIRAPKGTQLTCKNWLIEAAYRMLQNNLDPEVAFDPEHLIVSAAAARRRAIGNASTPSCAPSKIWTR